MGDTESTSKISNRGLRLQFSLLAALMGTTAVAVFLSFYAWLGKDGLALAAVVAPTISIPFLVEGSATHKARMTLAAILLTFGITWFFLFPKTWDVLRWDTFASILLGVGLIGGGLLLRGKRFAVMLLCTLLLWSVLLNLAMLNYLHALTL